MTEYDLKTYAMRRAQIQDESLSLLDIGFTETQVNAASAVRIAVENENIRFRTDGEDADGDGERIAAGQAVVIRGNGNAQDLRLIRDTSDGYVVISLGSAFPPST